MKQCAVQCWYFVLLSSFLPIATVRKHTHTHTAGAEAEAEAVAFFLSRFVPFTLWRIIISLVAYIVFCMLLHPACNVNTIYRISQLLIDVNCIIDSFSKVTVSQHLSLCDVCVSIYRWCIMFAVGQRLEDVNVALFSNAFHIRNSFYYPQNPPIRSFPRIGFEAVHLSHRWIEFPYGCELPMFSACDFCTVLISCFHLFFSLPIPTILYSIW